MNKHIIKEQSKIFRNDKKYELKKNDRLSTIYKVNISKGKVEKWILKMKNL